MTAPSDLSRERQRDTGSGSSGALTMLKIAATSAALSSNYGGPGLSCPFPDTSADQRQYDANAKRNRATEMLARAAEKRERKSTSRKAQFGTLSPIEQIMREHDASFRYLAER